MQNNSLGGAEQQNASSTALRAEGLLYSSYVANIVFNGCLCYSTTVLNIATIYALRTTVLISKPLRILILNLAVSDLAVGILGQPLYIAYLAGELHLKVPDDTNFIVSSLIWNLLYLSSFCSILALHADRFAAIHMPLRYNDLVTCKRTAIAVIAIWLFNILLVSFSVLLTPPKSRISLAIFDTIILVCLVTSTWLSYKNYLTIRRHKMEIQAQVQQVAHNTSVENLVRLRKSTHSTFWIYLVFCVCYLPNVLIEVVDAVHGYHSASIVIHILNIYLVTLMFLNSSLNPVIYYWKMRHIRRKMLGILQSISRRLSW